MLYLPLAAGFFGAVHIKAQCMRKSQDASPQCFPINVMDVFESLFRPQLFPNDAATNWTGGEQTWLYGMIYANFTY